MAPGHPVGILSLLRIAENVERPWSGGRNWIILSSFSMRLPSRHRNRDRELFCNPSLWTKVLRICWTVVVSWTVSSTGEYPVLWSRSSVQCTTICFVCGGLCETRCHESTELFCIALLGALKSWCIGASAWSAAGCKSASVDCGLKFVISVPAMASW